MATSNVPTPTLLQPLPTPEGVTELTIADSAAGCCGGDSCCSV